jgi:hypothetical protein
MTLKRRFSMGLALMAAVFSIDITRAFSQQPTEKPSAQPFQLTQRNASRTISFQKSTVVFATAAETVALMTANDPFKRQLSATDRQLMTSSGKPIDTAAMDKFLCTAGREFTADEKKEITLALQEAEQILDQQGFKLPIPAKVVIAKHDSRVQSGTPYTRANAVFFSDRFIAMTAASRKYNYAKNLMAEVLVHEFWHIASRTHPERRAAVYKMVGFSPCNISLDSIGADIRDKIITNPDVEDFGKFCIDLPDGDRTKRYTSLIIANKPLNGTNFVSALQPVLLEVQGASAVVKNGKTKLRKHDWVYYLAIGGNGLDEAWQPEEIVAKNLEIAFRGKASSSSPDLNLAKRIAAQAYQKP